MSTMLSKDPIRVAVTEDANRGERSPGVGTISGRFLHREAIYVGQDYQESGAGMVSNGKSDNGDSSVDCGGKRSIDLTKHELSLLVHAAALGADLLRDKNDRQQLRALLSQLQESSNAVT